MAKRDEFDININIVNPDGNLRAEDLKKRSYDNDKPSFVKEDSSRSVNENVRVQESQRVEKSHSVSSRPTFRKPELNMSFGSMITAIGTTTATVAVSVAVVVAVVVLAFSLSVTLVSATSDSLSFYVLIEQGDGKTFTAYLSQNDTVYQQSILGSDYVTFSNLTPNSEYNLRVVDDADGTEYYNQSFYTLQKSDDRATISNGSLKADGTLAFKVQVKDLKRDEFYTVRVTDGDDNVYLVVDDTAAERDFVLNVGNAKLAYISVAINGTIVCIKQLISETVVFGEPTFSWTETATGYNAVATFGSNVETISKTINATVTSNTTPATCENAGEIVYTATVTFEDKNYSDEKRVVLSAIGHNYGTPEWTWTPVGGETGDGAPTGGYTAKATFTCQNDTQHIENVDAVVTSLNVEATCEEGAKIVYTATATLDGREYQDTKSIVTGDPLGHDYGEPEWEWTEVAGGAADGSDIDSGEEIPYTAVAVFTCRRDPSHTMRLDGGDYSYEDGMGDCEEPGTVIYYARVTYNDVEYEGTKEVTVPATGHDYGEPEWNWTEGDNGGYSAVVAVFTCQNNPEHVENVQGEIASQDYDATCDEPAKIVYTATATFGGREYTDTKTITMGDPLGHDYSGEPEWEWTETQDGWTAEAVFTCQHCSDKMNLPAEIGVEGSDAGCDTDGLKIYYASVEYNDETYNAEKEVVIPMTGHAYGAPEWEWTEVGDGSYAATATFTCANDPQHVDYATAVVTAEPLYDNETEQLISTTYTATATFEGQEYTDTKVVPNV